MCLFAVPACVADEWQTEVESARKLILADKPAEARTALEQLRSRALLTRDDQLGLAVNALLLSIARSAGEWQRTEDLINEKLDLTRRLYPEEKPALANVYSELAATRRSEGKLPEAIASLQEGIVMRSRVAPTVELARDLTTLGSIQLDLKQVDEAKTSLLRGVELWRQLMRSDPEVLSALEPLAGLFRDAAEYEKAEPLYARAFRIREMAFGPDSPELLGALDSLAYVYFGQKKFAEAEPVYQRLLSLWEITAGPEHPMVALTLDKLVTFYTEQNRFEEAATLADRAVELRARALMTSYRSRARVAAAQTEGQFAVDLIIKADKVRELAGIAKPNQVLLPAPKDAQVVRQTAPARGKQR